MLLMLQYYRSNNTVDHQVDAVDPMWFPEWKRDFVNNARWSLIEGPHYVPENCSEERLQQAQDVRGFIRERPSAQDSQRRCTSVVEYCNFLLLRCIHLMKTAVHSLVANMYSNPI